MFSFLFKLLFCICSFWLVMYGVLFHLFCYILPAPSLFQHHSCMFYFISHWSQFCMFSFFSESTLIGCSLLLIMICSNYTIVQPQGLTCLPTLSPYHAPPPSVLALPQSVKPGQPSCSAAASLVAAVSLDASIAASSASVSQNFLPCKSH